MKVILSYSGGLDSTCLLLKLLDEGHEVRCLSVNYDQRHKRELESAVSVCEILGVEHRVLDLSCLKPLLAGSSQSDPTVPVPHGRYDEENMKLTVVPNRNAILLSVAGAWAISTKSDAVAYAAHAGDHCIYCDCRDEFVRPFTEALEHADWHKVTVVRPFLQLTKGEVAKVGWDIDQRRVAQGLRPVLGLTWTCYEGGERPCGKCGACSERQEAFEFVGVLDPSFALYAARDAAERDERELLQK